MTKYILIFLAVSSDLLSDFINVPSIIGDYSPLKTIHLSLKDHLYIPFGNQSYCISNPEANQNFTHGIFRTEDIWGVIFQAIVILPGTIMGFGVLIHDVYDKNWEDVVIDIIFCLQYSILSKVITTREYFHGVQR